MKRHVHRKSSILFSASIAVFFASAAHAQTDFLPHQISNVSITGTFRQSIQFSVLIENTGSTDYRGNLRIKPLLLPASRRPSGSVNDKGVVLSPQTKAVTLPAMSSTEVTYRKTLPLVPSRSYLLTAIINSDRSIPETGEAGFENNLVSDLVDVGQVSSVGPDPERASNDIYSDTFQNEFIRGGADHVWRMFKRGNISTDGMRALFLIADPAKHKIYGSSYEKGVHWGHSGDAYDSNGRQVPFDEYSQAPRYEHVPSGDLALLTLLDHTDVLREPVISNNLDVRYFSASHVHVSASEIWCTSIAGSITPDVRTVRLSTQYDATSHWNVTGALPSWLSVTPASGTLSGNESQVELQFSCNPTGLAAGTYDRPITVQTAEFPDDHQHLTLRYFVLPAAQLQVSAPGMMTLIGVQGRPAPPTTFSLGNPGTAPLEYRLSTSQDWILLPTVVSGTIPAGGNVILSVTPDNQTLGASATGSIEVTTNRPGPAISIPVQYVGSAPATL